MQTASNGVSALPSTRDRLLKCATELFALQGYQAISLRDLATHLGVSPGSIYFHIDSKQSLLFELIEDALNDLLFCTQKHLKRALTARAKLQKFVSAFVSFKKSSPHELTLILREQVNLTPNQIVHTEGAKLAYLMVLVDIVADLTKHTGTPPPRMTTAAEAIIGLLVSHGQWAVVEGEQTNAVQMLTHFADGIIHAYLCACRTNESGEKLDVIRGTVLG